MAPRPSERTELCRCAIQTLAAVACAAVCWGLMAIDGSGDSSTRQLLAALIFIPLCLSTIAAVVLLLNLACCVSACVRHAGLRYVLAEAPLRAITGRRRPDYERIAGLERQARV